MQKIIENLQEADRIIKMADHLIYMAYPLVQDKKLLLKILTETNKAIIKIISAILQFDYVYKKINLQKDPDTNFEIFKSQCAPRYEITDDELRKVTEIIELTKKHQESTMEFVRDNKIVIMSGSSGLRMLTADRVKEFVIVAKVLIKKVEKVVKEKTY